MKSFKEFFKDYLFLESIGIHSIKELKKQAKILFEAVGEDDDSQEVVNQEENIVSRADDQTLKKLAEAGITVSIAKDIFKEVDKDERKIKEGITRNSPNDKTKTHEKTQKYWLSLEKTNTYIKLYQQCKDGDTPEDKEIAKDCVEVLWKNFENLVHRMCHKVINAKGMASWGSMFEQKYKMSYADLFQEGYQIFEQALNTYNPMRTGFEKKGAKFSSWLCTQLSGRLSNLLNPKQFKDMTHKEAESLDNILSGEGEGGDDKDRNLGDMIASPNREEEPEYKYVSQQERDDMEAWLNTLPESEKAIFTTYFEKEMDPGNSLINFLDSYFGGQDRRTLAQIGKAYAFSNNGQEISAAGIGGIVLRVCVKYLQFLKDQGRDISKYIENLKNRTMEREERDLINKEHAEDLKARAEKDLNDAIYQKKSIETGIAEMKEDINNLEKELKKLEKENDDPEEIKATEEEITNLTNKINVYTTENLPAINESIPMFQNRVKAYTADVNKYDASVANCKEIYNNIDKISEKLEKAEEKRKKVAKDGK